jgi:hypothetical protein
MNKKRISILISILFLFLIQFHVFQAQATNESVLLPIMRFKSAPFASDLTDFFLGYPPHYFNVTQQAKTDFDFNNTIYGVDMGFNGTMYAYEHTFDVKYAGSSATRNDAFVGEVQAFLQVTSQSGNGGCTLGLVGWGGVLGAVVSLPLGTWVSVSMRVLFNLNQTNPTPNYKTLYMNLTTYDYGFVGQATHKLSTTHGATHRTDGTFLDLLQTVDGDYGGYVLLELKNQRWYAPSDVVSISVSSIPIDASVIWEDGVSYALPHNFSALGGSHTISATMEVSVADPSIRYLFQGWSIDGSPTTNTSNPLVFTSSADMTLQAIYTPVEIPDVVSLWANFGIGILGLIMMFLSWFVAYWCHKDGDTAKGILLWLAMFIIGYGFFTVLLGG